MKIFLDMDGVLAECHFGALEYYGVHLDEYPRGMRVKEVLAGMQIRTPTENHVFWAGFDYDFWVNLDKTDICDDLVQECAKLVGEENVYIASSPTDSPESYYGKATWVNENLPHWIQGNLILIQDKSLLAHGGGLLIDDHPVNCANFVEAGGKSILIERPWNNHDHMSWTLLQTLLHSLKGVF